MLKTEISTALSILITETKTDMAIPFKKYFGEHWTGVRNWLIMTALGCLGILLLALLGSPLALAVAIVLWIALGVFTGIGALGLGTTLSGVLLAKSSDTFSDDTIQRQTITLTTSNTANQPSLFPRPLLKLETGKKSDKNRTIEMKSGLIYLFESKEVETGGRTATDLTKGLGNFYVLYGPNPDYNKQRKTLKTEDETIIDRNNRVTNWAEIVNAIPPVRTLPLPSQINATVHCQCANSKYILIARDTFSDQYFISNVANNQNNNKCTKIFEWFGKHSPSIPDRRPEQPNKFDIIFIPMMRTLASDELEIPQINVASWKTLDSPEKSPISELYFDIENNKLDIKFENGKESHVQLSSNNAQKLAPT